MPATPATITSVRILLFDLPFALTTDQVNAAGKLYELTSWIDNDLRFTRVTTTEAYKPYFFIPNAEQPFMNLGEKNVSVTSIIPVTKDNITFKER